MKEHVLKPRTIPLDDSWDVIVVGGGPAGCTAAAAAAREGARTLLVEATGALGGMGTGGLVPSWCPFSDQEKVIYQGLAEKVFRECNAGMLHVGDVWVDWVPIDPERLKRVYDELVTSLGATVLFHTSLAAVEAEDGGITAAILANKAGLTAYRAKVYVDCTGDADLAAWAGAEFVKGDAKGRLQAATHCFMLTNVDELAYRCGPDIHWVNPRSPIHAILASGKYPLIVDRHSCHSVTGPRTIGFNAGHIHGVDGTDPASVSRALIHGRKMAAQYREALAAYHPAFANSFLAATGSLLGIRESRRIVGDYVLTLADYVARRSFPDDICRNCYTIDVHTVDEEESKTWSRKPLAEAVREMDENLYRYQKGESHGIPYRCLIPKGLRNVLVAGRSISCDHMVNGSIRVMPVCLAMGEGAGLAAAMAAVAGGNTRGVEVPELRRRLKACGAYLPDAVAG